MVDYPKPFIVTRATPFELRKDLLTTADVRIRCYQKIAGDDPYRLGMRILVPLGGTGTLRVKFTFGNPVETLYSPPLDTPTSYGSARVFAIKEIGRNIDFANAAGQTGQLSLQRLNINTNHYVDITTDFFATLAYFDWGPNPPPPFVAWDTILNRPHLVFVDPPPPLSSLDPTRQILTVNLDDVASDAIRPLLPEKTITPPLSALPTAAREYKLKNIGTVPAILNHVSITPEEWPPGQEAPAHSVLDSATPFATINPGNTGAEAPIRLADIFTAALSGMAVVPTLTMFAPSDFSEMAWKTVAATNVALEQAINNVVVETLATVKVTKKIGRGELVFVVDLSGSMNDPVNDPTLEPKIQRVKENQWETLRAHLQDPNSGDRVTESRVSLVLVFEQKVDCPYPGLGGAADVKLIREIKSILDAKLLNPVQNPTPKGSSPIGDALWRVFVTSPPTTKLFADTITVDSVPEKCKMHNSRYLVLITDGDENSSTHPLLTTPPEIGANWLVDVLNTNRVCFAPISYGPFGAGWCDLFNHIQGIAEQSPHESSEDYRGVNRTLLPADLTAHPMLDLFIIPPTP